VVRIGAFGSPTETVDVESGDERHLLVRPSPVPTVIITMSGVWTVRLRSSYLH
jgi:hypothetical protein